MSRLSLRNNRLNLKTSRKSPTILRKVYQMYPTLIKENQKNKTRKPVGLENTRILTNYAQDLPRHGLMSVTNTQGAFCMILCTRNFTFKRMCVNSYGWEYYRKIRSKYVGLEWCPIGIISAWESEVKSIIF